MKDFSLHRCGHLVRHVSDLPQPTGGGLHESEVAFVAARKSQAGRQIWSVVVTTVIELQPWVWANAVAARASPCVVLGSGLKQITGVLGPTKRGHRSVPGVETTRVVPGYLRTSRMPSTNRAVKV